MKNISSVIKIIVIVVSLFFLCIPAKYANGEDSINNYEEIVKEFFKQVLGEEVTQKMRITNPKISKFPSSHLLGVSYMEFYIPQLCEGCIDRNEKKVIDICFFTLKPIEKIKKVDINFSWLSKEEIIKKLQPLIEYSGMKGKDYTDYETEEYKENSSGERFYILKRYPLYNGVPCRKKGFYVHISRKDGEIQSFYCVPPVSPNNAKPDFPCPEEKIKEIAMKWLEENMKREEPKIDEMKKIELVITPKVNVYTRIWKEEFYYAWEVPFVYKSQMLGQGIHDRFIYMNGMIYIEPWTLEVF